MRTVHHLDGTDTYLYRVRVTFYRDNPDVPAGVTKIIAEGEIEMRSLKNEAAVKDEAVRYMTLHTGGQWTDGNITAITAEII